MATATEIIAEIRDALDEPSAVQWSDTHLRRWINEGGRDLARVTRHVKRSTSTPISAGTGTFLLAPDVIAVEVAYWNEPNYQTTVELAAVHLEDWNRALGGDLTREGRPTCFTTMGSQPNVTLMLAPTPTIAGSLTLFQVVLPTQIATDGTEDSTDINIPMAWYDALADYAEFKALRRDRDSRWQEAFQLYQEKRDALTVSPDYLAVNRGMMPDPATGAWVPEWLSSYE